MADDRFEVSMAHLADMQEVMLQPKSKMDEGRQGCVPLSKLAGIPAYAATPGVNIELRWCSAPASLPPSVLNCRSGWAVGGELD